MSTDKPGPEPLSMMSPSPSQSPRDSACSFDRLAAFNEGRRAGRAEAALVLKKQAGLLRARQAHSFNGERQRLLSLLKRLTNKIERL